MNKVKTAVRVTELDALSDVLVRLHKDAASAEGGAAAKDANLSLIMAEVESLSARITAAIKSDRVSFSLDEADGARDEVIRNLADALNGYAALPIAAKKAAAGRLLAVFNKYGKQIAYKSFAEESSLIESLIEDFSAEGCAADIAGLEGIGELVSALRAAQDRFNKAGDDCTSAAVSRGESATSVKKSLVSVLNDRLVPYLSAVAALDGYRDFAARCEAEIAKANAAVSARAQKRKGAEG
ncbi:MAG: hypothetical protein K2H09_00690 [Treponemataceae bacterium]|nr:hypothetical protein [Treponemataceae bacterium]